MFPPEGNHTHTVIFLHGLYSSSGDFVEIPEAFHSLKVSRKGIKFIFPNAPRRDICWPDGPEKNVSAWYNYYSDRSGRTRDDQIDMPELTESAGRLNRIIDKEASAIGGVSRVIVGGHSQGGTIAAHAAFTNRRPLGALIMMRTVLMNVTARLLDKALLVPVFVFRGTMDDVYIATLTNRRLDVLRENHFSVTVHDEPGLGHGDDSISEAQHCAKWIAETFHGVEVNVTHRDVPDTAEEIACPINFRKQKGKRQTTTSTPESDDYQNDYSGAPANPTRSHTINATKTAHCSRGAACCGHCCIGNKATVEYRIGDDPDGDKYAGSYIGRIRNLSDAGKVLIEFDDPNAEVNEWKISTSDKVFDRKWKTFECGYSRKLLLKAMPTGGPNERSGRQRWEHSASVMVDGRRCPSSSDWPGLQHLAGTGHCCAWRNESAVSEQRGAKDKWDLFWVPQDCTVGVGKSQRGHRHMHGRCPMMAVSRKRAGHLVGKVAKGSTEMKTARQTREVPYTDCLGLNGEGLSDDGDYYDNDNEPKVTANAVETCCR